MTSNLETKTLLGNALQTASKTALQAMYLDRLTPLVYLMYFACTLYNLSDTSIRGRRQVGSCADRVSG